MKEQTSDYNSSTSHHVLQSPLELSCGVTLKNRIAKSAMSDSLGNGEGDPTEAQIRLYERWAEGGTAVSIIGEVQGDPRFPEKPGNLVFGAISNQSALKRLVSRGMIESTHLWPQLGHAGALSHQPVSQPKGPSAIDVPGLKCTGMTVEEVQELPSMYVSAATFAKTAGFSGIHVHAGHGFLLSQFLSPLFNRRTDRYGGSVEARCQIILRIIEEVRRAVGSSYPIGIKINSTDRLEGGLTESCALEVVRMIGQSSIDIIDISGGTYFPGAKSSSDGVSKSGPYYLNFAKRAKEVTKVPLMLTGGFQKREQAVDALLSGYVGMISLARGMALNPQLPKLWFGEEGDDLEFPQFAGPPKGGITAWYTMRLTALGEDSEHEFSLDPQEALHVYEKRDAQRCIKWRNKFSHLVSQYH